MNTILAGMIGGWELILILAVVLIMFGAKKLPELARGLGQGIKEFKKATSEVSHEIQNAMDAEPAPPQKNISQTSERPPVVSPPSTVPKS